MLFVAFFQHESNVFIRMRMTDLETIPGEEIYNIGGKRITISRKKDGSISIWSCGVGSAGLNKKEFEELLIAVFGEDYDPEKIRIVPRIYFDILVE